MVLHTFQSKQMFLSVTQSSVWICVAETLALSSPWCWRPNSELNHKGWKHLFYESHPNCETSLSHNARMKQMIFALKMCMSAWMLKRFLVWPSPAQQNKMPIKQPNFQVCWMWFMRDIELINKEKCACAVRQSHNLWKGKFLGDQIWWMCLCYMIFR